MQNKTRLGSNYCLLKQTYSLAGYALLNPEAPDFPTQGSVLACRLVDDMGNENSAAFQWSGARFEPVKNPAAQAAAFTFWGVREGLEQAGAAIFGLMWRERLARILEDELKKRKQQVAEKEVLMGQMNALLARLKLTTTADKAANA